jgi:hypothetical protein
LERVLSDSMGVTAHKIARIVYRLLTGLTRSLAKHGFSFFLSNVFSFYERKNIREERLLIRGGSVFAPTAAGMRAAPAEAASRQIGLHARAFPGTAA